MDGTGWIDAAQHAAYHYDVASPTFTLPFVVGTDSSGNPISYPFTVHAILLQEMRVAEHGNADNATTATGGHPGNLVVPGDDQGVGHVDLSGIINQMTTGSSGTEAQVNITITRSDGVTIPAGTYDYLRAAGKLLNFLLPTTATAADFTITAALAGVTTSNNLCMAAAPLVTADVQMANFTIEHKTEALVPNPKYRTTIGIGEKVELEIKDWVGPPHGVERWEVSSGLGTVSPRFDEDTVYTAPLSRRNTTATVRAIVACRFGSVRRDISRELTFTILVPTGIRPYYWGQNVVGQQGTASTWIGSSSWYMYQALPDTVSFAGIYFRENIPRQTYPWPNRDSDPEVFGPKKSGARCGAMRWAGVLLPNYYGPDWLSIGPVVENNMMGASSWDFDVLSPQEFYVGPGDMDQTKMQSNNNWVYFTTLHLHDSFFGLRGMNWVYANGGDAEGPLEGPWQWRPDFLPPPKPNLIW